MPRIPRNYMNASFFHIMVQGIKKEYIFNDKENIEKYLKLLKEKNEGLIILAFCIMNNHAHILIKTEDINYLENWMRRVNTSYAKYYNKKNERVGYVFRNRYKSQQIFDIKYLYNCIQYIHNNPVKAGICSKQEEYEYSSLNHIYKGKIENIVKILNNIVEFGYLQNKDISDEPLMLFLEEDQTKEEVCDIIINNFKRKYDIEENLLRKNKYILNKLVKTLKVDFKVSYRTIEKKIGISRKTLRKVLEEDIKT